MSARYALDFAKVRADNPIERVAERLGIVLKPAGNQLRGNCPSGEGDDRAFVVTPAKGLWYSHAMKKGGDVLDLVAVVQKLSVKEAAAWLTGTHEPEKRATGDKPAGGFTPVEVEHDHPSVLVSGLEATDAKRFGIGYKAKGAGNGNILIPVYADGRLAGYVGVQDITWLPKEWKA